jgi:hypothetical protein
VLGALLGWRLWRRVQRQVRVSPGGVSAQER